MRFTITLILTILSVSMISQEIALDTAVYRGVCRDKEVHVANQGYSGTCTHAIIVNGKPLVVDFSQDFTTLNFNKLGWEQGDSLVVKLAYISGCKPRLIGHEKMLLEEVEVTDFKLTDKGKLTFASAGEVAPLVFYLQTKRWDDWVTFDTIDGTGVYNSQEYEVQAPLIEGKNEFRILRPNFSIRHTIVSDTIVRNIPNLGVQSVKAGKNSIEFERFTYYEVYNSFAVLEIAGSGNFVDLRGLKKGQYYINYDNEKAKFELGKGKIKLE